MELYYIEWEELLLCMFDFSYYSNFNSICAKNNRHWPTIYLKLI